MPTCKKEKGSTPYASYLSPGPDMSGTNRRRCPSGLSDGASAESKGSFLGTADATPACLGGVPGQVSMADIVRIGRPHNTASQDPPRVHQSEVSSVQEVPVINEWPSIEILSLCSSIVRAYMVLNVSLLKVTHADDDE